MMETNITTALISLVCNVVALCAVAVFGAQNCQFTTKADARHKAQLSTKPAIEPTAVIGGPSFGIINLKNKQKCQKKNKQQYSGSTITLKATLNMIAFYWKR